MPGQLSAILIPLRLDTKGRLTHAATPPAMTRPNAEPGKLLMPPLLSIMGITEGVEVADRVAAAVPLATVTPVAVG